MAATSVPPPNPHSIPYVAQVAQYRILFDTSPKSEQPKQAHIIRFSFQSNRVDANNDPAALTVVRWDSDGQRASFQRFFCLPNGQAWIQDVDRAHPLQLSQKLSESRVVVKLNVAMDESLLSRLPEIVAAWNTSHRNGATSLQTDARPQDPDRMDIKFLEQLVGTAWGSKAITQVEAAVKNPPRQQAKSDAVRTISFK